MWNCGMNSFYEQTEGGPRRWLTRPERRGGNGLALCGLHDLALWRMTAHRRQGRYRRSCPRGRGHWWRPATWEAAVRPIVKPAMLRNQWGRRWPTQRCRSQRWGRVQTLGRACLRPEDGGWQGQGCGGSSGAITAGPAGGEEDDHTGFNDVIGDSAGNAEGRRVTT